MRFKKNWLAGRSGQFAPMVVEICSVAPRAADLRLHRHFFARSVRSGLLRGTVCARQGSPGDGYPDAGAAGGPGAGAAGGSGPARGRLPPHGRRAAAARAVAAPAVASAGRCGGPAVNQVSGWDRAVCSGSPEAPRAAQGAGGSPRSWRPHWGRYGHRKQVFSGGQIFLPPRAKFFAPPPKGKRTHSSINLRGRRDCLPATLGTVLYTTVARQTLVTPTDGVVPQGGVHCGEEPAAERTSNGVWSRGLAVGSGVGVWL